jgi:hypothetical protein
VLVQLGHVSDAVSSEEEKIIAVLHAEGFVPRWSEGSGGIDVQVAVAGSGTPSESVSTSSAQ